MTEAMDQTEMQEQQQGGGENSNIKHLRERAEQAGKYEAEANAAKRELAVIKSGIDFDHPMGKFFVEHYDGDITDTSALVEQAKAMGVPMKGAPAFDGTEQATQTQQSQGEPQVDPQAQQVPAEPTGTEQRRALAGEDPNLGEVSPDPRKTSLDEAQEAIDKGATYEQAGAHMVSQLASAAKRGDGRVLITEERQSDGRVIQRWNN